ncbi:ABC transporter ATP-binding protein [Emergencia timonensis]|uniref:ABC transporter ATP-binding protein n=1 Tax=Emergencia timonensis TaxID=1776384 RepID=UPI00399511F7
MNSIEIEHLTKDYGNGKGVFDVSLAIKQGEVYGYLGPNGAGKSTTMRHLMGFSKPQSGTVNILGLECWSNQKEIQGRLGYLPGEIAFQEDMTGIAYLKLIAKMRHMKDFSYGEKLIDFFELDPSGGIKRMSKGMKQKIGIVAAFMHDPQILLLDEPTSGLDPLMQNRFVELIEKEKKRGKTILLSSHIFEEVEKTCDRIGMIRKGKLVKEFTVDELRHSQLKTYKIEFAVSSDMEKMKEVYPDAVFKEDRRQMIVSINDGQINALIRQLAKCDVHFLKEEKHTLEEYFMQFYGGSQNV